MYVLNIHSGSNTVSIYPLVAVDNYDTSFEICTVWDWARQFIPLAGVSIMQWLPNI